MGPSRIIRASMSANLDLLGDPPLRKLSAGYAGRPGEGPQGETCGSCANFYRPRRYGAGFKCRLVRDTHGAGTDIRKSAPACQFWTQILGVDANSRTPRAATSASAASSVGAEILQE